MMTSRRILFPLGIVIVVASCYQTSGAWVTTLDTRNLMNVRSPSSSSWPLRATQDGDASYEYEYQPYSRQNDKKSSLLEASGAVLYRKSVFSREEFAAIQKEVSSCRKNLQEECSNSIAEKRYGTTLAKDSSIVALLEKSSLHCLVERVTGKVCELSSQIPVEIRSYEREGAGMAWHVDDTLYDPPQIEIVWTLENDSDCKTMWKEVGTGRQHSVETEPNSVVLLLAGGASHCVTHLKYGKRIILKCAYIETGAVFREGVHQNQFDNKKQGKKKKKQRSEKR